MLTKFLTKIFGSRNDRILRKVSRVVDTINQIEPTITCLNDKKLANKTFEFRERFSKGETLDNLLPEAFAVIRETSKRVFGMRHFDAQLMGGIVLNNRCIAEMRTGEGKTLTATLPAYLNAITRKSVHLVTVNDYLAQRDAENNRPLFEFLGLRVGVNLPGLSLDEKRMAYAADITYGTNNEYGFDYLRDNIVFNPEDKVQRKLYYALVDEVDSILIDEARTPLIISGAAEDSSDIYRNINKLIPHLIRQDREDSDSFQGTGHFSVDEKSREVNLTERGLTLIEELLVQANLMRKGESLYSPTNIILMHHVTAALRAHALFFRDVDYIVKENSVIIVDEHTGRTMPGRRWSDGLHQAIEAKENVKIQSENQTLASITFQNYFRLYEKLAGMTGTADTEAFEFRSTYKLDTIVIPTNRPVIRQDLPDLVYMTEKEKIEAIIEDIKSCTKRGQPVLVGTISIEKSELVSKKLDEAGIPHKVLNAKYHAMEAKIIAQAGKPGAVTIATNMAGRGTDIVLGGSWRAEIAALKEPSEHQIAIIKKSWKLRHNAVIIAGGLHIIGTERHESRRIDNQLRGRAGRQGDPGSSRFYLSMEDTLMRIFASDLISGIMRKLGIKQGEAIEHPWITRAIASAQSKVENRNFEIRKQLLEYDDVVNDQRQAIYSQRNDLLNATDISDTIKSIRKDVIQNICEIHIPSHSVEDMWDITALEKQLWNDFSLHVSINQWLKSDIDLNEELLCDRIHQRMVVEYQINGDIIGNNIMRKLEKSVMLQTLDSFWKEHLAAMDYLRQGIHLRGYAQKDPKQEYKRESFAMFSTMLESLKYEVVKTLSQMQTQILKKSCRETGKQQDCSSEKKSWLYQSMKNSQSLISRDILKAVSAKQISPRIKRNDPCFCGSGKKFKHCHGKS